ncbi:MAG TPA: HpcH/HpaI aldolase/citrate lyase family protein, partial [Planctomycetaceae bacterium]|nr:HpcH/HpaI aldolase/citrate lyase family protein [Planctomycetaceae bacterium]
QNLLPIIICRYLCAGAYCVGEVDWESARKILHDDAPPVFRHDDAMCEPATHRRWAEVVRDRAQIFGVG